MKSFTLSLLTCCIIVCCSVAWINQAKDQWITTLASHNSHFVDFCSIDDTLLGCDDPDYK